MMNSRAAFIMLISAIWCLDARQPEPGSRIYFLTHLPVTGKLRNLPSKYIFTCYRPLSCIMQPLRETEKSSACRLFCCKLVKNNHSAFISSHPRGTVSSWAVQRVVLLFQHNLSWSERRKKTHWFPAWQWFRNKLPPKQPVTPFYFLTKANSCLRLALGEQRFRMVARAQCCCRIKASNPCWKTH